LDAYCWQSAPRVREPWTRSGLLLILWGWTFMGVLKDSDWGTVLGGSALCVVLVPLGIKLLKISPIGQHGRLLR